MRFLFQRPSGSPMLFHLAELPSNELEKFTQLITLNGGKVEPCAKPNVLTFTSLEFCYNYKIVYDIKFIEDCIKFKTILDVDKYFIGDTRITRGCPVSAMIIGSRKCLLNQLLNTNNCEIVIEPNERNLEQKKIKSLPESENGIPNKTTTNVEKIVNENLEASQKKIKRSPESENRIPNKTTTNVEKIVNENLVASQKKIKRSPESENRIPNKTTANVEKIVNENLEASQVINKKIKLSPVSENKATTNVEKIVNENLETNEVINAETYSPNLDNSEAKHSINEFQEGNKKRKRSWQMIFSDPGLKHWVENLNKDRPKNGLGYPRKFTRTYSTWENMNLILFISHTNAYEFINSLRFWKEAAKLKLVDINRKFNNIHAHMISRVLPNIEKFSLSQEEKDKFIKIREKLNDVHEKKEEMERKFKEEKKKNFESEN